MDSYRSWQNKFLYDRLAIGRLAAMAGMIGFVPLDTVVHPDRAQELLLIRAISIIMVLLTASLDRTRYGRDHAHIAFVLITWSLTFPLASMTFILDGFASKYFIGMIATHIGAAAIWPARWTIHLAAQVGTIIFYYAGVLLFASGPVVFAEAFANGYFIFWTLALSNLSIFLYERLHRESFIAAHELEIAHEQLAKREWQKTQYFQRMKHQLKSLIGTINRNSNDMHAALSPAEYHAFDPDKMLAALEESIEAGGHLRNIIRDVLDQSDYEANKIELSLNNFKVADACQEAVDLVLPSASEHNNRIEFQPSGDLGAIRSDYARTRQVIRSVLTYVVLTTEEDTITVEAERVEQGDGDRIDITISNTGLGLSPEQRARLFLPYTQSEGSDSGLGLVIARNLCRLMGGDINVGGRLGKGITFIISLPSEVSDKPEGASSFNRQSSG